MKLSNLFVLLIFASLTLFSCKKDDAPASDNLVKDYEGTFSVAMTTTGITNSLDGLLKTSSDKTYSLTLPSGVLRGTIETTANSLTLRVTQNDGLFKDCIDLGGSISDTSTGYDLSISGTYTYGVPITVSGAVVTVGAFDQAYRDSKTHSSVYVTHDESCLATITINGTTLSPLNNFYTLGGFCNPMYDLLLNLHRDVDGQQSALSYQTLRLKGLDGNYFIDEDCNTAFFALPKNTEYTYTAEWSNGEITTGTFTSPDGALQMALCIENDGAECTTGEDGNLSGADGSPRFNLAWGGTNVYLELIVTDPFGNIIDLDTRNSPTGGVMDVICDSSCPDGSSRNVLWRNGGPAGVYTYTVISYESSQVVSLKMVARDNGATVSETNSRINPGETLTYRYTKN
ncbi:hypothetical protein [Aequorivita viscosa]|uniref:Lipocalin-like domain-containing protein n=1 Tax=Aequorivita viscosa TaxID=797419 RepID=A0A1M6PBA3_9FLAO|nr:hypothetical protein [Aequorivita viscosa]SDX52695.1 hypothetical protein SAMN05216556_14015 [Aequorivita viscosa]SHK05249.1 hypothetical protein SAMN04487908_1452 [Aequorivita viscosa]